jgi:fucose 4-O-acetylase-like acetyltransferase
MINATIDLTSLSNQQSIYLIIISYLLALGIWYLLIPLIERIKTVYLITGTVLIGLAAGYVSSIGSVLSLSRVIVFFPFFVIGFCMSGRRIETFLDKKLRLQALFFFLAVFAGMIIFRMQLRPFLNILYGASDYHASLGSYARYGFIIRGIWYLLAAAVSGAFMLLVPRCRMFYSVLGERTLQVYLTHIWIRNILVYAGFFTVIKESPEYLAAAVLLASVILTFLLANIWFKKIFDFLSAPLLFKKVLR